MRAQSLLVLIAIFVSAVHLSASEAQVSEKRVALVIGNAAYKDAPLKNPVNDARAMAARLKALGFEVIARENATRQQMAGGLAEFARKVAPGSASLIYYAGHGIQARGRNYLIPVDATLESETDLRFQAVDLDTLTEELQQAQSRVSFLILDACRNNPFERRVRGGGRGLAAVDVASGTLVAYATAPGSVASDGDGDNGVYTAALLKALAAPGLKAEEVFKRVRADVATATNNRQTPWGSSSLTGDFVFNLTVNVAPVVGSTGPADREALFWQSAQSSNRAEEYEEYLKQFPQGMFAGLARSRVASLKVQPQVAAAPVPPPAVVLEPIDKEYVATQTARLREQPDVKSKQIGQLKEGDTLLVLGKVKGQPWYQVERRGEAPAYVSVGLVEDTAAYKKRREAETQQAMVSPTPTPSAAAGIIPAPGRAFRDCPECPEVVMIPAGTFIMGSPPDEVGRDVSEGPLHSVSVRGFALGKYEITRGEFGTFVRESGYAVGGNCYGYTGTELKQEPGRDWRSPGFPQSERDPVVCVNWDDAKAYVAWLSRKTGKTYRLPAESEWEYSARAQTVASRYWGEDASKACAYANVADRAGQGRYSWTGYDRIHECDDGQASTAPVGSYPANGWGLHDMLGNVWEWAEDCWNKTYDGAPKNESAWTTGECGRRVLRGGAWGNKPASVRLAGRSISSPADRYIFIGFRVARTS